MAQAVEVCKVNIGTLIGWRKRYRATGDVKMKIRRPVTIRKSFLKNTHRSTTSNRTTSSKSHK